MDEKRISYNRQSNRLQGYDYSSPGYYFVTIVSHNRLSIFGEIVSGEVQLNQIGDIVERCWKDIPLHFPDVSLEAYVIMPNHHHGIVKINENQNVGTMSETSPFLTKGQDFIPKGSSPRSLGAIIGSFKSATTKQVHRFGLTNHKTIWQRNFYEHVIRDDEDYQRIVEYVQFNPINWEGDQEFFANEPLNQ